ncbi:unnamed protein product [Somion occarium]|uniref:C2H2-type domain-containing protein n=1 Tax=Somion occarium TaxID=3059160 RepID=A0ABP1EDF0_9APHY
MEHLRSHTEGNPNQCGWPECGKIFANEDHRELHESFHFIRTRLNYCEGCKRNFRKKDALNRHLRSEGGAKCRTILEKTASSSGTEGANDGSAAAGASGTSNGQTGDTTLDATTKPDPNKHWTAMKGWSPMFPENPTTMTPQLRSQPPPLRPSRSSLRPCAHANYITADVPFPPPMSSSIGQLL